MTLGLPSGSAGLYDPAHEHDACGVGFVAHIKGVKSHEIIEQGLMILKNLDHRGAVGADTLMSDGAGILIQMPDAFLRAEMAATGVMLPPVGEYGVGMCFLPKEHASRVACEEEIARAIRAEGQILLGWRDVPVSRTMPMSPTVKRHEPVIRQVFVGRGPDIFVTDALERKLYVIRRSAGNAIKALRLKHSQEFYMASFSARTIVYKGLLLADQVSTYFLDLQDARCVSALALVHQRFSTNTFPSWHLAHPFRMIAHNGEINTLRGNVNWFKAREKAIASPILGEDLAKIWPLHYPGQSDSASFDNALELLVMGGYSLAHAMMLMIPEAWEKNGLMHERRRAFYEYHAAMMEPWDGPAAVAFTDGRQIGATLDRNGLRPARYCLTDNDLVVMASEAGVLPIAERNIVRKWRLQPGKMLLVDLEQGRIVDDDEIKNALANAKPYREWVEKIRIRLDDLPGVDEPEPTSALPLLLQQKIFAYSQEDIKFILEPMALHGEEATGSMGNDAALTVLSLQSKPFYNYFRQLFAQVTNPPIDPVREDLVMSLLSFVGPKPDLLNVNDINPPIRLEVSQPILSFEAMQKIRHIGKYTAGKIRSYALDIGYPVAWGKEGIEARLASLVFHAEDAVRSGANILIISDRRVDADHVAIPALLATSAVHQHLVRKGLRTTTGLVVETGSAREVHHFALLGGYGAEAVHPYLALESVSELAKQVSPEDPEKPQQYMQNFIKAIGKGLLKVMSKMGISTYMSYTGAQIFEAVGLQKQFVDQYFTGTASHIEGIGIFDVAAEAVQTHLQAFHPQPRLSTGGEYAYRVNAGDHLWTPDAIAKLQHATRSGKQETYAEYARLINEQSQRHLTLRGLFVLKRAEKPVPLETVEPAAEIVKRFSTGAMSLGSISTEAHTSLAIAMNRLGGKSNTGEGGEDAQRFLPVKQETWLSDVLGKAHVERDYALQPGDSLRSAIKQVASGRFGVTAAYLVNADQIQIKMAQGAKPGEGGQLPGHKVSEYIGFLRHAVPGVGLISPPPHHDIYSIEDLAQLIHDLKSVNHHAAISVKLVSELGVGTVAAGVAKAKADHIVIAGHDGGTGAAPLSSIKHAGTPWELGLAETQQTLVLNRLRGRVRLQVDGQLKTGRDVVIGALLGADEFGFATAPLVSQGCIMMRKCHLNTCPVGVATQDPVLRKRFSGQPEHLINYFFFVAEEVRAIMAELGIRRFEDLIGQVGLLNIQAGITHWKAQGLDFGKIFYSPECADAIPRRQVEKQDHQLEKSLDHRFIKLSQNALDSAEPVEIEQALKNTHRSVGCLLSGEIARRYGHAGLPEDTIRLRFSGTAGQSFGAFLARGVSMELWGEANDYVGKSLSGGRIVIRPSPDFSGDSRQNIIVGNTVLYGAIAGEAYLSGVAGERFCVRNSGATAVVEGVGDHGCEYMTAGTVVVLGTTGRNFAAGMSGGIAYVLDETGTFRDHCHLGTVDLEAVQPANQQTGPEHGGRADETLLQLLVAQHAKRTGSRIAQAILADWEAYRGRFVKVFPREYRRVLSDRAAQNRSAVAA